MKCKSTTEKSSHIRWVAVTFSLIIHVVLVSVFFVGNRDCELEGQFSMSMHPCPSMSMLLLLLLLLFLSVLKCLGAPNTVLILKPHNNIELPWRALSPSLVHDALRPRLQRGFLVPDLSTSVSDSLNPGLSKVKTEMSLSLWKQGLSDSTVGNNKPQSPMCLRTPL